MHPCVSCISVGCRWVGFTTKTLAESAIKEKKPQTTNLKRLHSVFRRVLSIFCGGVEHRSPCVGDVFILALLPSLFNGKVLVASFPFVPVGVSCGCSPPTASYRLALCMQAARECNANKCRMNSFSFCDRASEQIHCSQVCAEMIILPLQKRVLLPCSPRAACTVRAYGIAAHIRTRGLRTVRKVRDCGG